MTLIDPIQLKPLLGEVAGRVDVVAVAVCDSTNSQLLAHCANLPSGSVLVADQQQAGRGRRGRVWAAAPEASLTFSLLWRIPAPATRCNGLSLAVGLAMARAFASFGITKNHFGLKWPNDVLMCQSGRPDKLYAKLAGMLIELVFAPRTATGQKPTQAIIGIGLNLAAPPDDVGQLAAGVNDLFAAAGLPLPDRHTLFAALLRELVRTLDEFCTAGFAALRYDWEAWHVWQNQLVHILDDGQELQRGLCLGVDGDGALLLHTAHGVERVLVGDVSLRPL